MAVLLRQEGRGSRAELRAIRKSLRKIRKELKLSRLILTGEILGLSALISEKLDNMNEMSEMTSLRLQMMMDRRSKFIETLSNIMKKMSETDDMIVKNIK